MGTEINLNQYVTAASFAAGKTSGGRNEKTEKSGGIRKKFSEILHKNDSAIEMDPDFPAEIADMRRFFIPVSALAFRSCIWMW